MNLKDLENYTGEKTALINALIEKLEGVVSNAQLQLHKNLLEKVFYRLDLDGNKIANTTRNKRLLSSVDTVFNTFSQVEGLLMLNTVVEGVDRLIVHSEKYFEAMSESVLVELTKETRQQMNNWLGIETGGKLKSNGYLKKLVDDPIVRNSVKDLTIKNVVSRNGIEATTKSLENLMIGKPNETGALQRYYKNFVYDTYSISDRIIGLQYADKLGYNFSVYEGGLIKTSREFCIDKNGKVYHRSEIAKFNPTVARPPNYNPFTDLGGYRCRHHLNWINNSLALYLRPDAKKFIKVA